MRSFLERGFAMGLRLTRAELRDIEIFWTSLGL